MDSLGNRSHQRGISTNNKDKGLLSAAIECFSQQDAASLHEVVTQAIADPTVSGAVLTQLATYSAQLQEVSDTINCLAQAYLREPNNLQYAFDYGFILKKLELFEKAIAVFESILTKDKNNITTLINLASCYNSCRQPQPEKAIALYRQVLTLNPPQDLLAITHYNLGNAYRTLHDVLNAKYHYEQALQYETGNASMWNNYAICLQELKQVEASITAYQKSIALDPNYANAHFGLGLSYLLLGDLRQGWREYEWRWRLMHEEIKPRQYQKPTWHHKRALAGKTIYCYTEQGFGDSIQFVRYIPLLKAQGATVIVECQQHLINLFTTVDGIDELVSDQKPKSESEFDFHLSFLSLPSAFNSDLSNLPIQIPYLQIPKGYQNKWQGQVASHEKFSVAFVWAGNKSHKNDHNRSCDICDWQPLFEMPKIKWICCQLGARLADIIDYTQKYDITVLAEQLGDFSDTAAVLGQCDLVITVDTSVAHLAGALGLPVWVLIPFAPDWRWMLDREDSPWYPSMRLFRQTKIGDWQTVFQKVSDALENIAKVR